MQVTACDTYHQLEQELRHLVASFNGVAFYPLDRRPAQYERVLAQLRDLRERMARAQARVLDTYLKTLPMNSREFRATVLQLREVRQRLVRYRTTQLVFHPGSH